MSRTFRAFALASVLLSACAPSTAKQGETTPGNGTASEETVCHEESSTGSNISRTVCRPKSVSDEDRDSAQRNMRRPVPAAAPPAGGR